MKQILITHGIKALAKEYADNLFVDKTYAFVQPIDGLKTLIIDLQEVNEGLADKERYIKYISQIIADFEKLKTILPREFTSYKEKYDGIIQNSPLTAKIKYRKTPLPSIKEEREKLPVSEKEFYKLIVDRMHYSDTRLYLGKYMNRIGINTCVYCNIAKATFSEDKEEVYYPFDHNKPTSEYPFLCISFFNLYPCCDNCNRHKLSDEKKGFDMYTEVEPSNDPFVFEIDRKKVEEGNPKSVIVDFKARNEAERDYAKKYDDWFRINDLYNSDDERRSSYQMLKLIDKCRASYPAATEASFHITVDRRDLFEEVLGVKDDEIVFTDVKKKLKIDTAKDAGLI